MVNILRIDPADTVATAVVDIESGAALESEAEGDIGIDAAQSVPFGHKIALLDITKGDHVIKYGASIGAATADIRAGEHVHSHNLVSIRGAVKR